jgi:hypothetical protein
MHRFKEKIKKDETKLRDDVENKIFEAATQAIEANNELE